MAYRRCLLIRGKLMDGIKTRPSLSSYIFHSEERKGECSDGGKLPVAEEFRRHLLPRRPFSSRGGMICCSKANTSVVFPSAGYSFCRNMSTETNQGTSYEVVAQVLAETTEAASDQIIAQVLTDTTTQANAAQHPLAFFECLLDTVHSYTGLNWWATIALTTVLIRCAALPWTYKYYANAAVDEGKYKLFSEREDESMWKRTIIGTAFYLSFTAVILQMAKKVPSFTNGGAYWFVDLTTPDNPFNLPLLYGMLLVAKEKKHDYLDEFGLFLRVSLAIVFTGFTMTTTELIFPIPKAVYCYWITSSLFSLGCIRLVPKVHGAVKKILDPYQKNKRNYKQ